MVPNTVMNELIVPLALASLKIQCNETFSEEVVAGARSAIEIAG